MRFSRLLALTAAVGVLATGPACAKKNEDKKALLKILARSTHVAGVFRYSDSTPTSSLAKGHVITVRGVIEDDFRYKARLTVDNSDVLDEVVNDDALAVRFVDPTFIPQFTGRGAQPEVLDAMAARYWIEDPRGAPSVGDAAVKDQILGLDPIVDALSVNDYVSDAISQSREVEKFNAERIDYRPGEDPFPRPAPRSGVTRWDLVPMPIPRADASDSAAGDDASLARAEVFRKMSIYVKNGRVVQIREQLGATYDLVSQLRNYIERYAAKISKKQEESTKHQLDEAAKAKDPRLMEAALNLGLNQILGAAGVAPVRFRSMKYEFSEAGTKQRVDLPIGTDVKQGDLGFFGVNQAARAAAAARTTGGATVETTSTTATTDASTGQ